MSYYESFIKNRFFTIPCLLFYANSWMILHLIHIFFKLLRLLINKCYNCYKDLYYMGHIKYLKVFKIECSVYTILFFIAQQINYNPHDTYHVCNDSFDRNMGYYVTSDIIKGNYPQCYFNNSILDDQEHVIY